MNDSKKNNLNRQTLFTSQQMVWGLSLMTFLSIGVDALAQIGSIRRGASRTAQALGASTILSDFSKHVDRAAEGDVREFGTALKAHEQAANQFNQQRGELVANQTALDAQRAAVETTVKDLSARRGQIENSINQIESERDQHFYFTSARRDLNAKRKALQDESRTLADQIKDAQKQANSLSQTVQKSEGLAQRYGTDADKAAQLLAQKRSNLSTQQSAALASLSDSAPAAEQIAALKTVTRQQVLQNKITDLLDTYQTDKEFAHKMTMNAKALQAELKISAQDAQLLQQKSSEALAQSQMGSFVSNQICALTGSDEAGTKLRAQACEGNAGADAHRSFLLEDLNKNSKHQ